MPAMTQSEMEEFLKRPLVVSFTTIRPDGSPQTTPIWFEYDKGKFYCWTGSATAKVRNVGNNPQVALCIATHDEPYKYVIAEGGCEIVREGVKETAYSISTRYWGRERGPRFVDEEMKAGTSILLVVTPTRLLTESAA